MVTLVGFALAYARPHSHGYGGSYYALDPAIIIAIVVGSLLLPLILIIVIMSKLRARARKEEQLLATGTPALARVLSVQQGNMTVTVGVQRRLSLVLSLEVHLPGRAPYTIQVDKLVSELHLALFQPNLWLEVRVNPSNPSELAVVGAGKPPTQAAPPTQVSAAAPVAGAPPWSA
jgi:hypothetical protein